MGEDQILGQVKDAHDMALRLKVCHTYLNTFFRYAVTAAKRVKTDTKLSKTPVSTAVICIRAAQDYLGTLAHKNILIIGASGKIGSVVLKNLLSEHKANIYVTTRDAVPKNVSFQSAAHCGRPMAAYRQIPYEQRYDYLAMMDVVISATSSPHYTLTYDSVEKYLVFGKDGESVKPRAFMDLAVPLDIESRIGTLPGVMCSNIDDFGRTARDNNAKKQKEAQAAKTILEEYKTDFEKWLIFQNALADMDKEKARIAEDAKKKDLGRALDRFFYRIRENATPEQLEVFMECLSHPLTD